MAAVAWEVMEEAAKEWLDRRMRRSDGSSRSIVPKAGSLDRERKSEIVDVQGSLDLRHQRHRQFLADVVSEDCQREAERELRKIVRDRRHRAEQLPTRLVYVGLGESVGHTVDEDEIGHEEERAERGLVE